MYQLSISGEHFIAFVMQYEIPYSFFFSRHIVASNLLFHKKY
jgi:hypothetical protein